MRKPKTIRAATAAHRGLKAASLFLLMGARRTAADPSDARREPSSSSSSSAGSPESPQAQQLHARAIALMVDADFGVPQAIPLGRAASERTRAIVRRSAAYMYDALRDPELADVIGSCMNMHEDCSQWAASGLCEQNAPFTGMYCGPACRSCKLLDVRKRCPLDPDAADALRPGDLDGMFERIVSEPSMETEGRYGTVEVLSRPPHGPWVVSIDDFLSSEECDRLIAHGHAEGYEYSVETEEDFGGGPRDVFSQGRLSAIRTSSNAWCEQSCEADPIVGGVLDRISDLCGVPRVNSEHLQLLRYQYGQRYGEHHDYVPHEIERPEGVRVLTVYLYLNDVDEGGGGETRFPRLNSLTAAARRGRALLWPSVLSDNPSVRDDRTVHEALPVWRVEKYGANAWLHMRDFRGPMERFCHL